MVRIAVRTLTLNVYKGEEISNHIIMAGGSLCVMVFSKCAKDTGSLWNDICSSTG